MGVKKSSQYPLSFELRAKIDRLFAPERSAEAALALENELNIEVPMVDSLGGNGIERVRCAVLKLSAGSLERLGSTIMIAQGDWRDVLVAAGFADGAGQHLTWLVSTEQR